IHDDVTLSDLKHQLNSLLHFRNQRRITEIEYRRPSVCSNGSLRYTGMKLQNDGYVRTMFSIFSRYMMKGPIELDTKLVRSVEDIMSNIIRLRTFDEITACMVRPEEDEVEAVNLSDP
ncbi:hypothetical protein A2U01_0057157, partial [Trifolium medium]|nr:hypothetical protein [Trifolium medium]